MLDWQNSFNGMEAKTNLGTYRADVPDSEGGVEVRFKVCIDRDAEKNWNFVCYEYGCEAAKNSAQRHADYFEALISGR